jgi:hypothetical protein
MCCVSTEIPPHIASYLPEALLAKAKMTASEIAVTSEDVQLNLPDKDTSVILCPRPLKHHRITPSAVTVDSPPSQLKLHHPTPCAAASDPPASPVEFQCIIPAGGTLELSSSPSAAELHHTILNPC